MQGGTGMSAETALAKANAIAASNKSFFIMCVNLLLGL
jgi:hypothetical protein